MEGGKRWSGGREGGRKEERPCTVFKQYPWDLVVRKEIFLHLLVHFGYGSSIASLTHTHTHTHNQPLAFNTFTVLNMASERAT